MKNYRADSLKKSVACLLTFVVGLFATSVFAHDGHGAGSAFIHDLEHASWTFALVAVGAVIVGVYKYRSK